MTFKPLKLAFIIGFFLLAYLFYIGQFAPFYLHKPVQHALWGGLFPVLVVVIYYFVYAKRESAKAKLRQRLKLADDAPASFKFKFKMWFYYIAFAPVAAFILTFVAIALCGDVIHFSATKPFQEQVAVESATCNVSRHRFSRYHHGTLWIRQANGREHELDFRTCQFVNQLRQQNIKQLQLTGRQNWLGVYVDKFVPM